MTSSHSKLWGVLATSSVASSHSGYRGVGAERHDQHYKNNSMNFGVAVYLCDRIFGSYEANDDNDNVNNDAGAVGGGRARTSKRSDRVHCKSA